jgi:hypothetical protein
MQFSSNFNAVQNFTAGRVRITGTSVPPEGATALFREVAVQQGELMAHGRAAGGKDWAVELTAGFDPHEDAVAIGTETYVFDDPKATTPAFATFTWAQKITFTT